jgi:hypothetical protein
MEDIAAQDDSSQDSPSADAAPNQSAADRIAQQPADDQLAQGYFADRQSGQNQPPGSSLAVLRVDSKEV